MGPTRQYAADKPDATIELRVYAGADGKFSLYEDEGDGYGYEKGKFATIPLHWDNNRNTLTIGRRKGRFPGMRTAREFRVTVVSENHGTGLLNAGASDVIVQYSGMTKTVHLK